MKNKAPKGNKAFNNVYKLIRKIRCVENSIFKYESYNRMGSLSSPPHPQISEKAYCLSSQSSVPGDNLVYHKRGYISSVGPSDKIKILWECLFLFLIVWLSGTQWFLSCSWVFRGHWPLSGSHKKAVPFKEAHLSNPCCSYLFHFLDRLFSRR